MKLRDEIIERMNALEKERIPFFLFLDFEGIRGDIFSMEELEGEDIHISFPGFPSKHEQPIGTAAVLHKFPESLEAYAPSFQKVMQHIRYGNSFLTNLTCSTSIHLNQTLQQLYPAVRAKYKVLYKNDWLCFSPETFVRIHDGKIKAFPMKGTIDASLANAAKELLDNEKEKAEHYTIVDLIRNDLSIVAEDVSVKRFRYLDKIQTNQKELLQMSSEIEGKLLPDLKLSDIIFKLLPAGSISGAPKKKTVEIIKEAETHERNFYTGTAYYYDGTSLDSCVLIRFIERSEKGYVYKSGGGITINSEIEKEYQEMVDKVYLPLITG